MAEQTWKSIRTLERGKAFVLTIEDGIAVEVSHCNCGGYAVVVKKANNGETIGSYYHPYDNENKENQTK